MAEDEKVDKPVTDKNPLGEHVQIAMNIIYNTKTEQYGLICAPGFLDVPDRAYYALRVAEKNLDEFYFKKKTFRESITQGVRNFNDRMKFRNFLDGRFK